MLLGWPHVSFCVSSRKSFGSGEKSPGQLLCCVFFFVVVVVVVVFLQPTKRRVFFFKFTHQKSKIDTKNDNPPFPNHHFGYPCQFSEMKIAGRKRFNERLRRTRDALKKNSVFGRIWESIWQNFGETSQQLKCWSEDIGPGVAQHNQLIFGKQRMFEKKNQL